MLDPELLKRITVFGARRPRPTALETLVTMPASEVRAAAEMLRVLAIAAHERRPAPWSPGAAGSVISRRDGGCDYVTGYTISDGPDVAHYISAMDPAAGGALADLLDDLADGDDEGEINPWALALARVINDGSTGTPTGLEGKPAE
ncbi:hypothetical protein [Streptomyces sp. NPDC058664]|uniref:hypothetical protein n=1 Tax=unclassified Streptomyces TaxID=2593676 RepID=UPI00365DFA5F